jgi:hypothetical protein
MATVNVTPDVKATKKPEPKLTEVKVSLHENESALIVNSEVELMISEAFAMQDDIENASKFTRAFIFDAVKARLAYNISATINQWESVLNKATRLHPTQTREELAKELMVSKAARALCDKAQLAKEAKKKL